MGPFPLNSLPLPMCWQSCVCTLCTECMEKCDEVLVYTTEAAPIYHEVEYTYSIGSVDGILILWNQTTSPYVSAMLL